MDRVGLLTANYAAAWGVATLLIVVEGRAPEDPQVGGALLVLGGVTGALFILGFFLLSLATEVAGMSLATGVMRLSVVIPFLASWLIWDEVPSAAQGVGLVVAGAAFFLIAQKEQSGEQPALSSSYPAASYIGRSGYITGVLVGLFLVGGTVDVFMKAFDEGFEATSSRDVFLVLVFGVAFSIGAGLVIWRGRQHGRWPARRTVAWGLLLGLINYSSVVFILRAIRQLSGPFVFPANNIALVMGAALLGVLFWGERLTRKNWVGMGMAALALFLLSR